MCTIMYIEIYKFQDDHVSNLNCHWVVDAQFSDTELSAAPCGLDALWAKTMANGGMGTVCAPSHPENRLETLP